MVKKWLSLDEFITPIIIRFVYVVGTVLLTLAGLIIIAADIFNNSMAMENTSNWWGGLVLIIGGNLALRLFCESWLLLFGIYERLKK